jgi:hypothetical protein
MRQTIQITIDIDVDHELARLLPGLPGDHNEPPIEGLEIIAEDLRTAFLATVAEQIARPGSGLAQIGAITLGGRLRIGNPYQRAHEPF